MQIIEADSIRAIAAACDHLGAGAQAYKREILGADTGPLDRAGYYPVERVRFHQISADLGKPVLVTALQLAVAQFVRPSFYHLLKRLTKQSVTLALAYRICGKSLPDYLTCKDDYEKLTRYLKVEKKAENFLFSELFADEHLVLFLAGEDRLPDTLQDLAELFLAEFSQLEEWYGMEPWLGQLQEQIGRMQEEIRPGILQLKGSPGRGRRTLLKKMAKEDGTCWIFADLQRLFKAGRQQPEKLWQLRREALLYQGGICLYGLKTGQAGELQVILRQLGAFTYPYRYPVCVCTGPEVQLAAELSDPVHTFALPEADRKERIRIWQGYSQARGLDLDPEDLGIRYRLTPGDIQKIVYGLGAAGLPDDKEEQDLLIAKLCTEIRGIPKNGSLTHVDRSYTMEDLQLEPSQKQLLLNICDHVYYSRKVYDQWDMGRKYPYGRGIAALFWGPPGTGKTMAANVLSAKLKLPLYKIDLSQIVDKYIGETEKRLEEVFAYAESSNVILFFDEADSLFGKRTEVKDSKDKYANNEVSFLLQRIEHYDGVVLLSTNLKNNMDEAFLRRMRYVIGFQLPDVKTRRAIWQSGFSPSVPLKDIDLDLLAREVELSGGYIRNIILNALFDAASDGLPVTMHHIIKSICNEYGKLGKLVSMEEFERFGIR